MGYQVALPGRYPVGQSGELTIAIEEGSTHVVEDFSLEICEPVEIKTEPTWLLLNFEGTGSKDRITNRAGLGGLGWEEININWEDLNTLWQDPITL